MWDNLLLLISSDNGGDCGFLSGACSNYPLLGRKCTPFQGGTNVAAVLSGGLVLPSLRGTSNAELVHVSDW